MIETINNFVSKVVSPLYVWGPKPAKKKPKLIKAKKCKHTGKCKCN